MLLTTFEMAQRLEEADVLHLSRQVQACSHLFPDQDVRIQAVGQGLAAVTLSSFRRKLNHVVRFGMAGPVSSDDFAVVENLYAKMTIDTEIDLCPLSDTSVLPLLSARGYIVNGWINIYARRLTDEDLKAIEVPGVKIFPNTAETKDTFPFISLCGTRSNGLSELLMESLGRIAELRADTRIYFAKVDGKIAGSAGLALIETRKGGVAHLYIDSTLPEYRGRGVQSALLRARLRMRGEQGLILLLWVQDRLTVVAGTWRGLALVWLIQKKHL